MKIGAHVSIAGGIDNAPGRAAELGCEVFQIFSRSPQGGPAPKLTSELVDNFLNECEKYKISEWVVHTPYYINLANAKEATRKNSARIIREELERASVIGAAYVMTHIGSSREVGPEEGLKLCVEGVKRIMDGYDGSAKFLIEIAAGSGHVIGGTFEEIAEIIKKSKADVEVCFDTQHAFGAGYDLSTKAGVKKTLDHFDATVGLDKLKISHCNDSKVELGSQKDRHEHIGEGFIGTKGFEAWFADKRTKNINLYIETKHDAVDTDIKLLKKLRG